MIRDNDIWKFLLQQFYLVTRDVMLTGNVNVLPLAMNDYISCLLHPLFRQISVPQNVEQFLEHDAKVY